MTHDAMAQVAAQRERLAERARLPWWYWVLFTLATVGLVGSPLLRERLDGVAYSAFFLASLLVYLVADRLARRARGVSLSSRTMRSFPSSRLPGTVFVVVVLAALLVVVTTAHSAPGTALAALVVGTVLAVASMAWLQRAMLADVRAGRARPA